MSNFYEESPIRIPVKLVDGKWEYFYGGELPIKNAAIGELIVDKVDVTDKEFLAKLKKTSKHKILEAGRSLLVALTVKNLGQLDEGLRKYLISPGEKKIKLGSEYYFTSRSGSTHFVKITIGQPTDAQKAKNPEEKGGVWLHVEGIEPKRLSTSTIDLPEGMGGPADSLNHTFTLLSERYEPWRKSHTGNIYNQILYQENNNKWYPLDLLRKAAIAKEEHEVVRTQWENIVKELATQTNN